MNRRYEIDWIRNISILMLFVYHTAAIFCMFGDFYIISEEKSMVANILILLMFVWYMPTLFFLAGASTYFASKKRDFREYIIERVKKLLVPLIFGILVLVPPQTYLARLWRGETSLSYIEHLKYFFTHLTDFTGYDGAFSPAHLWFILYFFVVSTVGGFFIFKFIKKENSKCLVSFIKRVVFNKYSFLVLLTIGFLSDFFPSIMGKSILGCLIIFIAGYFVYSDEKILNALISKRFRYLGLILVTGILGLGYVFLLRDSVGIKYAWYIDSILKNIVLISAVASIIGFSSLYLNSNNRLLRYLNKSAFPVYIIHQPILLVLAYFIVPIVKSTLLAMVLIIVLSFIATFLTFELIKRIKILNIFLGIK